jgi:DNA invertase Pin-like site-specific DNA recombinase
VNKKTDRRVAPAVIASADFDPAMNRVDPLQASGIGVIYARYSSHSQRDVSIEQQVKDCFEYAARNNIYLVACYADRHLTGRSDRRPEFHRMLRDAETGGWNFVVTWKNDRFARNRYDAAIYKAKLKKHGIRCLFSQEYIPAGPEGILLEAMLEGDAEFRSAQMAVDVKRGMNYNAEHCMVNGPFPYGYRRAADGRLELDSERALIVKEIFDRFLSGWNIIDIANDLNTRGIRTSTGKEWSRSSFHRLLTNERYTGVYIYDTIRTPNGMPAIIDRDTWLAVQHRLRTKKNPVGRSRSYGDYLLTGKLFCGHCGSPMVGVSGTSKTSAKHHYYACQGRRLTHNCTKKNVRRDYVESMVCRYVVDMVLQPNVIEWMADCVVDYQRRHRDDGTIQSLTSQLKQTQSALNNVLSAIEAGIFTASTKERLLELESQAEKLKRTIETEKALRPTFNRERIIFWLEQFRDGDLHDPDYQFRLVSTFVNAVYLYDDHIKIVLNHSGRSNTVDLPLIESACSDGPSVSSYIVENGSPNSTGTNSGTVLYFAPPVFVLVASLINKTPAI